LLAASAATAQPADFYRGKTLNMLVGVASAANSICWHG